MVNNFISQTLFCTNFLLLMLMYIITALIYTYTNPLKFNTIYFPLSLRYLDLLTNVHSLGLVEVLLSISLSCVFCVRFPTSIFSSAPPWASLLLCCLLLASPIVRASCTMIRFSFKRTVLYRRKNF